MKLSIPTLEPIVQKIIIKYHLNPCQAVMFKRNLYKTEDFSEDEPSYGIFKEIDDLRINNPYTGDKYNKINDLLTQQYNKYLFETIEKQVIRIKDESVIEANDYDESIRRVMLVKNLQDKNEQMNSA